MRLFCFLFLLLLTAAAPATAQSPIAEPQADGDGQSKLALKNPLDTLYARLAAATEPEEAEGILRQIERLQHLSGSPTADLLMDRAVQLAGSGDIPLASELMERILVLAPRWPEAWYQRALLFQLSGDTDRASMALIKTLSMEPRHIQALEMLGELYADGGDEKNALFAYRQALILYPGSAELQDIVRHLSLKVEGKAL